MHAKYICICISVCSFFFLNYLNKLNAPITLEFQNMILCTRSTNINITEGLAGNANSQDSPTDSEIPVGGAQHCFLIGPPGDSNEY